MGRLGRAIREGRWRPVSRCPRHSREGPACSDDRVALAAGLSSRIPGADEVVREAVREANHAPVATVNGQVSQEITKVTAEPGIEVALDAVGSNDPDGNRLAYRWYVYPEAGTYGGEVTIESASAAKSTLRVPRDAAGKTIHVILEVTDDGTPALTAFRRMVITAGNVR